MTNGMDYEMVRNCVSSLRKEADALAQAASNMVKSANQIVGPTGWNGTDAEAFAQMVKSYQTNEINEAVEYIVNECDAISLMVDNAQEDEKTRARTIGNTTIR